MKDAKDHNSFIFGDKKLKNVKELLIAIEDPINSDIVKMHVNESKNDFSNWIKDVLEEEELAIDVRNEKEISKIAEHIRKYIDKEETRKAAQSRIEEIMKNSQMPTKSEEKSEQLNYNEEKAKIEESDSVNLKKDLSHHREVLKKTETRHFCPKYFDCMKKEFLFGFILGIIVGIVIAIFTKMGAI